MKNVSKILGTFALAAIVPLLALTAFAACDIVGTTTSYTVSFNSNGGTEVSPVAAQSGAKITRPADPTREPALFYAFAEWYKDQDFNDPWDFLTDRVNTDITLYAKWTPLKQIGDFGPGGGRIFDVAGTESGYLKTGFKLYTGETEADNSFITVYYLEAAHEDLSPTSWASTSYRNYEIPLPAEETGYFFITGKRNTALILATDQNAYAAKSCRSFNNSGKNDWFLPGENELMKLCANKAFISNLDSTEYYWSSTQHDASNAVVVYFSDGVSYQEEKKTACRVRPIRAF